MSMENGTEQKKHTRVGEILQVLMDHVDLVSLEAQFEARIASRRLGAFAAAFILVLAAFIYLQVALIQALAALGLQVVYSCLIIALIYCLGAALLVRWGTRRDPKAGRPFEATRREMEETVEWIQKLFS